MVDVLSMMPLSIDIIFLIIEFTPEACILITKNDLSFILKYNQKNHHNIDNLIRSAIDIESPLIIQIAKQFIIPDWALTHVCAKGNLKMLKWMRNLHPPPPLSEECLLVAAKYGHFDILKWLLKQVPNYIITKKLLYYVDKNNTKLYNWLRNRMSPLLLF